MAAEVLRKVQAGQRLRIPASAYNAFVDAARDHQSRQRDQGSTAHPSQRSNTIVLVKNASGIDAPRFGVLGIDGPLILPADNLAQFENEIVLKGVAPTEADHADRFVVLLEPLATNAIGRACVDGVCIAKIDVADEADVFAEVSDGLTTHLTSSASGSTRILWKEVGTGIKWAYVRLAGGGSGAPSFWIRLDGASSIGPNRWAYTAALVEPLEQGQWKVVPGSSTVLAYNSVEADNGATGMLGIGITVESLPAGYALQPVRGVRPAWRVLNCDGQEEMFFQGDNTVAGACA